MEIYKGIAKEYQKVLESLGWEYNSNKRFTEITCRAASGEKHSFSTETANFVQDIKSYANEFNIDEYVSNAYEPGIYGAVPPISALVDDAREVQRRIKTLSDALSDIQAAMIIEE